MKPFPPDSRPPRHAKDASPAPQPSGPATPSTTRRLLWLLACATVGVVVGLVGVHFTGKQVWFLAVPGALAIGWLVFADPEACVRPDKGCHKGGGPAPW